jgi:hypothetical protein
MLLRGRRYLTVSTINYNYLQIQDMRIIGGIWVLNATFNNISIIEWPSSFIDGDCQSIQK